MTALVIANAAACRRGGRISNIDAASGITGATIERDNTVTPRIKPATAALRPSQMRTNASENAVSSVVVMARSLADEACLTSRGCTANITPAHVAARRDDVSCSVR